MIDLCLRLIFSLILIMFSPILIYSIRKDIKNGNYKQEGGLNEIG